jgi:hypothetical protein
MAFNATGAQVRFLNGSVFVYLILTLATGRTSALSKRGVDLTVNVTADVFGYLLIYLSLWRDDC